MTCGGRYITNDLIQIGCTPLNEDDGPTIIVISYSINDGVITRGNEGGRRGERGGGGNKL